MPKTFSNIVDDWNIRFDKMKDGEKIEISVVGKRDPDLFIDMCKNYINTHPNYEFSSDYKFIRKLNTPLF
jgi:hypothetical protein